MPEPNSSLLSVDESTIINRPLRGSESSLERHTPESRTLTPEPAARNSTSRLRGSRFFQWIDSVSLELENTGSVARDHLASERTWLAYVRTSLAIASAGVALVQLFAIPSSESGDTIHRFARPLGSTSVLLSFIVLLIGLWRYFDIQVALTRGKFSPARWTVAVLSAAMAIMTAVIFGFLVVARPE